MKQYFCGNTCAAWNVFLKKQITQLAFFHVHGVCERHINFMVFPKFLYFTFEFSDNDIDLLHSVGCENTQNLRKKQSTTMVLPSFCIRSCPPNTHTHRYGRWFLQLPPKFSLRKKIWNSEHDPPQTLCVCGGGDF